MRIVWSPAAAPVWISGIPVCAVLVVSHNSGPCVTVRTAESICIAAATFPQDFPEALPRRTFRQPHP